MGDICYYDSPLGRLGIAVEDGAVTRIFLAREQRQEASGRETALHCQARQQLDEYFAGERSCFSLPLAPRGTPFQQRVWQELQAIPYGETAAYGQIAERIGHPQACRAVGGANHANPIFIVIP